MNRRTSLLLSLATWLISVFAPQSTRAAEGERIALVLGNGKFDNLSENQQLFSPGADATAVAKALQAMGYTP